MPALMTYWQLDTLEANAGPLDYTSSGWFGRLAQRPKSGDRVFVVSERNRRMLLAGSLTVAELLTTTQATRAHPDAGLWDADWHIFAAAPYHDLRHDLEVPLTVVRRLRNTQGRRIAVEPRGYVLRPMALNAARWLDDPSAVLLSDLLAGRGLGTTGRITRRSAVEFGAPYRAADVAFSSRDPKVFSYDPDARDRQTRAHHRVQEMAARAIRELGFEPRSPIEAQPQFDVAYTDGRRVTVIEVKSLPATHIESQLRLGIGQVLEYASRLSQGNASVRPVLLVEREPPEHWRDVCQRAGIVLAWPEVLLSALQALQ